MEFKALPGFGKAHALSTVGILQFGCEPPSPVGSPRQESFNFDMGGILNEGAQVRMFARLDSGFVIRNRGCRQSADRNSGRKRCNWVPLSGRQCFCLHLHGAGVESTRWVV